MTDSLLDPNTPFAATVTAADQLRAAAASLEMESTWVQTKIREMELEAVRLSEEAQAKRDEANRIDPR